MTDFRDGSNNIVYGSYGGACILPNGEVALASWHSGALGVTLTLQENAGIVLDSETGARRTLTLPSGDGLTVEADFVQSLENYSGICITRAAKPTAVGILIAPHWTERQARWLEYPFRDTQLSAQFYLEGIWGRGYTSPYYDPPNTSDNGMGGTFGGCVSLKDGRALMWVSNEFQTWIHDDYRYKGIIFDPEVETDSWYWTQANVVRGRHCRTAQLLPDGRVAFFNHTSAPITFYDPLTDTSEDSPVLGTRNVRCCCLHPDSGLLYFNGIGVDKSYLYAYDVSTLYFDELIQPSEADLHPYNSMQPLASGDDDIDRVVLFPGDDATVTTPKIVEFNKVTRTFTYTADTTDVGYGYSCSVYLPSGDILLVPSKSDVSFKLYTPDQAYIWDRRIVTSLYMGSK